MLNPGGPDLCYALAARKNARYLSRAYDSKLLTVGLSVSQFSILSLVETHKSLKLMELAEMMVMERTSLVRALAPLQNAGWVAAERRAGDRSFSLQLTPAGLAKVAEAAPLWLEAQAAFEARVGRENAVQMRNQILEQHLTR